MKLIRPMLGLSASIYFPTVAKPLDYNGRHLFRVSSSDSAYVIHFLEFMSFPHFLHLHVLTHFLRAVPHQLEPAEFNIYQESVRLSKASVSGCLDFVVSLVTLVSFVIPTIIYFID